MNYEDVTEHALELFDFESGSGKKNEVLRYLKMLFTLFATEDPTLTEFSKIVSILDASALQTSGIDYRQVFSGKGISFYALHFEEKFLLGSGSFGSVHLVRHKLDGGFYAMKKIDFVCQDLESYKKSRVFREATHLSRIDSPHIVRYYSSWVEYGKLHMSTSTKNLKDLEANNDDVYFYEDSFPEVQSLDFENFGLDSVTYENSCDWGMQPPELQQRDSAVELQRRDSAVDLHFMPEKIGIASSLSSPVQGAFLELTKSCKLFLQMEFGGSWNLRDYLDDIRRIPEKRDVVFILTAILKGLVAVHSQNIVHRDLKPSNIFINVPAQTNEFLDHFQDSNSNSSQSDLTLSMDTGSVFRDPVPMTVQDWVIKLGDFGLSKNLNGDFSVAPKTFTAPIQVYGDDCTHGVGTYFYGAPEQIEGMAAGPVSSKADLFSVGIILAELLSPPFITFHERLNVIQDIRRGRIPEEMQEQFPYLCTLIPMLLDVDPNQRISASRALGLIQYCDDVDFEELMSSSKQALAVEVIRLRQQLRELQQQQEKSTYSASSQEDEDDSDVNTAIETPL